MKTIEELRKHHNALAEQTLEFLMKKEDGVRSCDLDSYLADVMEKLVGKDEYWKQEKNCTGVVDEVVKSMLKDGLLQQTPTVVSITNKGKIVSGLTYPVFAKTKNWVAVDYIITKSAVYTDNATLVLLIPAVVFGIVILEATGVLQQLKEFLCKSLLGFLQ